MNAGNARFLARLGIAHPILQAPMAGVSTPALAAAVSNAGGLGSLGLGADTVESAAHVIAATRALTKQQIHLNVFCHRPAVSDANVEREWLARLAPEFARYGSAPPVAIGEIYTSFLVNPGMLTLLLDTRPEVISFHFGLPPRETIAALRQAGIILIASATSPAEAKLIADAGLDAVIAQGYEAGGHRGLFDADARDDRLGTLALTRLLATAIETPIIAAGGIMDGAGIAVALQLGAVAAQLGTAFVGCPESSADRGYRAALASDAALHTVMTRAISGRPARCLANKFTAIGEFVPANEIPAYPIAYDAGKALHAAAKAKGEFGFGAQWAGQGAPLSRTLPAAELVAVLAGELVARTANENA
ncbi:MAG TPA: nitronate monooxygenase [Rhizomicrobium sp.]|jgi:nitronate monooxygenase|nr:nitronate monooxygenase [Rhizomicrobium sp.]